MKIEISNQNYLFIRKDKDSILAVVKPTGNQLYLNKTSLEIYELAKEFKDTGLILNNLKKKYSNIDVKILEKDMIDTLKLLDIYNIIFFPLKLNNKNDDNEIQYKIAGDNEYRDISNFILQIGLKNNIKYLQDDNEDYYKPLAMRSRTFNNKEYFIFAIKENDIKSVISILPPEYDGCKTLNILSIFFKPNLGDKDREELILNMFEMIIKPLFPQIEKIRINEINNLIEELNKNIEHIGFIKECVLKNETIQGDLIIHSKFL